MAYRDAAGVLPETEKSPFGYSEGNRRMMKEYGMSEEEFAYEFGGRPHQQRQSPVSRTDLKRLRIPQNNWDFCSHKVIPWYFCIQANGMWFAGTGDNHCGHFLHEWELCQAAEFIRQNQVLQVKRRKYLTYSDADKNWLYNDPNYGHMFYRSKYGPNSFKGRFMMGAGTRCIDPPNHELEMASNPKYNPEMVRSEPHPGFNMHKQGRFFNNTFKHWWNKHADGAVPALSALTTAPDQISVFDPVVDGPQSKPW